MKFDTETGQIRTDKDFNHESYFLDILHSTSQFYFEQGVIDEYNGDIIIHNTLSKNEGGRQIERFGFFKAISDFTKTHEDDWLLILNDLRDKYTQRKKLWNKLESEKGTQEKASLLFILLIVVDIRKKFCLKLYKYLENELDIQFEDYEDERIKKSEDIIIINRGEPWIKVTAKKRILDSDIIEKLNKEFLVELKTEILKYNTKTNGKEGDNYTFKKFYPYETTRNDVAYVLMYGNQKTEIPLLGTIYSILEN